MDVLFLIVAFVVTISSAQYTDPVCPIEEEPWCATRCNLIVDEPICVTQGDGTQITLRNQCVLDSYNCKCQSAPLEFLHEGKCYIDPVCPIEEEPWCAVRCNLMVYAPICVSQGGCKGIPITLRNQCVLSGYNCKCKSSPLKFLYEGVC